MHTFATTSAIVLTMSVNSCSSALISSFPSLAVVKINDGIGLLRCLHTRLSWCAYSSRAFGVAIQQTCVVHIGGLRGLTFELTGPLRRAGVWARLL